MALYQLSGGNRGVRGLIWLFMYLLYRDNQIRHAGRWNNGDQMTDCYITTLPFEFMRATADFEPVWAGSYYVARATM